MKKTLSCLSIAAFAAAVLISVPSAHASANPIAAAPAAPQAYGQETWANPPSDWRAAEQRGFRAGIRGARKDAENHRQPNVNNRDEYRHPDRDDIPGGDVGAYQQGFRRGYWTGVQHLMGYYRGSYPSEFQQYQSQQQGGYYPNEAWAEPSSQWQAAEQKGFRDGVRGAYKDAQNHRQPNVNNRDEYRHPDDVPGNDRRAYREGFRRGYWTGVQHLMGYYNGPNPYRR